MQSVAIAYRVVLRFFDLGRGWMSMKLLGFTERECGGGSGSEDGG